MLIRKVSELTHEINEMELDVTEEQIRRWQAGEKIQNVMPHLTPAEREFIMSGITPYEWRMHMEDED